MKLDAIIAPTIHWTASETAIRIAEKLHAQLVTLASPAGAVSHIEIAHKRNEGLAIARETGWRAILFLDDDIIITADQVADAARLLDHYPAVGHRATDFPDHSVVYHAAAVTECGHPVKIGGGALLLDMNWPHSNFQPIYNEDWFFLYHLYQEEAVADAGEVQQIPYNPYTFARVVQQEFGDLIAEGLNVNAVSERYWVEEIARRRNLQEHILAQTLPSNMRQAILAARNQLNLITPDRAVKFARSIIEDDRSRKRNASPGRESIRLG